MLEAERMLTTRKETKQTDLAMSSAPRCDIRILQRDEIVMTGGEVWRYSGAGMLLR
jgi:hypothetical protein